jgi:hypothetical protein
MTSSASIEEPSKTPRSKDRNGLTGSSMLSTLLRLFQKDAKLWKAFRGRRELLDGSFTDANSRRTGFILTSLIQLSGFSTFDMGRAKSRVIYNAVV